MKKTLCSSSTTILNTLICSAFKATFSTTVWPSSVMLFDGVCGVKNASRVRFGCLGPFVFPSSISSVDFRFRAFVGAPTRGLSFAMSVLLDHPEQARPRCEVKRDVVEVETRQFDADIVTAMPESAPRRPYMASAVMGCFPRLGGRLSLLRSSIFLASFNSWHASIELHYPAHHDLELYHIEKGDIYVDLSLGAAWYHASRRTPEPVH